MNDTPRVGAYLNRTYAHTILSSVQMVFPSTPTATKGTHARHIPHQSVRKHHDVR